MAAVGANERFEYFQHALHLGPGVEGLQGYVDGALVKGSGASASVLVAASK